MLKLIVDSLDNVEESQRSFYEEKDGKFHLKVEGLDDTGALKRAKDREKADKQAAQQQVRDLQDQLTALQKKITDSEDDNHRKNGDVEALEKSWQTKFDSRESELTGQIESLTANINKILVDGKAQALAAELAVQGSAEVLTPHIRARLAAEQRDGQFTTVVLGTDGKPSALTIEELKTEISGNEAFKPLLAGSKASGSGASGSDHSGGAAKTGDMGGTRQERVAAIASKHPELAKAS